jgi:sugar phosphate isomerase/epimerase
MGCPPPEMTYLAARTGYDCVSLRLIPLGLPGEPRYELGTDKAMLKRTKAALTETGLKLLDIEVARILDGVKPRSYLPAMEAAAELGGRHVLTSAWTSNRSQVIEDFSELCDLAQPLGLTVDFEFVAFAAFATLAAVRDVVREANRDNGGVMIDTLHFRLADTALDALSQIPSGNFHFAQICDARTQAFMTHDRKLAIAREERLYLGEGNIDVAAILGRMPLVPCSLEVPNLERVKSLGYEEHARLCLASAKDYLGRQPIGNESRTG